MRTSPHQRFPVITASFRTKERHIVLLTWLVKLQWFLWFHFRSLQYIHLVSTKGECRGRRLSFVVVVRSSPKWSRLTLVQRVSESLALF